MINVAIFVPNCNQGGTERVAARLENMLRDLGYETIIITIGVDAFPYPIDCKHYKLDEGTKFNYFKKIRRLVNRYTKMKNILKENSVDIIFSMGEYPNILSALMPKRFKKIARVTNSFSSLNDGFNLVRVLTSYFYKKLDSIIVPADFLRVEMNDYFNITDRIYTVYNFIDIDEIFDNSRIESQHYRSIKRIVHIGQLVEQKNQKLLLTAFKEIKEIYSNVELVIIGKGILERELKKITEELGLSNSVQFLGWQNDPYKWLKSSDIFMLTSKWEGMPNVLIESMACGCPVISFDCPSGPNEIITKSGENGILIPSGDVEKLVNETIRLLSDDSYREVIAKNALIRANDFDIKNIRGQYKKILENVCVE